MPDRPSSVGANLEVDFASVDAKFINANLDNGLTVMVAPQTQLQTASIALITKVGSRYENAQNNGASHFLEHMLFRGNRRFQSPAKLNYALESIGGTLNALTQSDLTMFQVNLPAECLHEGLDIISSLWDRPAFNDIEIERKIIREEVLEDFNEQGLQIDADNVARELLFGSHPLGYPIIGSRENIERFNVTDLQAHFSKYYSAPNMVLCVGGNCEADKVLRSSEQLFSYLPVGAPNEAEPFSGKKNGRTRSAFVADEGNQCELRLSFPSEGEKSGRRTAILLMLRMLDDGMSTPLYRTICEEQGLAYEVFADVELFQECGVVDIGTTVELKGAAEMTNALLTLLGRFAECCDQEALDKAKRRYLWDLRATLDDADEVAALCGGRSLFGLQYSLASMATGAKQVQLRDIQTLANEIFVKDNLHLTCIGDIEGPQKEAMLKTVA